MQKFSSNFEVGKPSFPFLLEPVIGLQTCCPSAFRTKRSGETIKCACRCKHFFEKLWETSTAQKPLNPAEKPSFQFRN
jgi:hypothetical protein